MRIHVAMVLAAGLGASIARAQDYKVEVLKEAPPATLAAPVRSTLEMQGYRVTGSDGKPFADIWLRKGIPASAKPSGPSGVILFPVLAEGELLGALRFPNGGRDFRDQAIPPGVYTLRYGLQPVNGDHLGASPYRDFALLIAAAKDTGTADLETKKLTDESAEAAGSSHPGVLMFLPPPEDAKGNPPTMIHDEAKATWGVVVPLSLAVKGSSAAASLPVQLVVVGAVMM